MYNIVDKKAYIIDLLKRKGITGKAAREFMINAWG